jgi:hypothetical protein
VKLPQENATIGLLLCKEKKDAVVELTLPKDANIHAREYQLYLPSKELLKAKLLEWTRKPEGIVTSLRWRSFWWIWWWRPPNSTSWMNRRFSE